MKIFVSDKPIKVLLPIHGAKKERVWEIDFLRGICIVLMVFDHFMFDASMLDKIVPSILYDDNFLKTLCDFAYYKFWKSEFRMVIRIIVVSLFLLLSGISCSLSKNNLLRALKLSLASGIMTVATLLIEVLFEMDEMAIYFGILHCLALSVFVFCLISAINKTSWQWACLLIGLLLTVWGMTFDYYHLPQNLPMPENVKEWLDVILGFRYYGADCFGLIPYTGLFLIGACGGKLLYANSKTTKFPKLGGKWQKPVSFIGRNTLWVYLLHQPLILLIFAIMVLASGYTIF